MATLYQSAEARLALDAISQSVEHVHDLNAEIANQASEEGIEIQAVAKQINGLVERFKVE